MSFDQETDPRVVQVTQVLRGRNICLWEPPYWSEGKTNFPQDLIDSVAAACSLTAELAWDILNQLQRHALERLEDKKLLNEKQLLTIRVKVARQEHVVRFPQGESMSKLFEEIALLADTEASRIRLIYQGRLLPSDEMPLCLHDVKQNAKMTALLVSKNVASSLAEERALKRRTDGAQRAKKTATMAAAMGRCEITNQFGKKVDIPDNVRLELTGGLALHNKARVAMQKNQPHDALAWLLEAESSFQIVQQSVPEILSSSGNLAQLNLDVVWCFLEIGSLAYLNDAEQRLSSAEKHFKNVYGSDLEKVVKLKGNATNELTQLTRLELLKGVAAFYKAEYAKSKACFEKANSYMTKLHVDETALSTLVSMGYSLPESRLALRQADNNVQLATDLLANKQEQREAENDRWQKENLDRYLQGVNLVFYNRLLDDIGVPPYIAREALLETDNDYARAEALAMEMESARQAKKQRTSDEAKTKDDTTTEPSTRSRSPTQWRARVIAQLVAMGESVECAEYIYDYFEGDVHAAKNFLLTGEDPHGCRLNKMIADLKRFVSNEPDDYLDSTLEKEMACFNTFMVRLAQIESTSNGLPQAGKS